ncbi:unnamed protein product [Soboliphyme baturini]|uniref:Endo/exonuclease/phosphatase domain-containing protein n=1 Tax=Soboliphyme baturini TaxID=241478 RepID=A0A183J7H9_9BILA|nr:unnamed protein product [Soboliphyme baturini]
MFNCFDFSRVPSWCDRILWLVEDISGLFSKQLECQLLNYNSDDRFTASDHKPVLADFKIQICGLISTPVVVFLFPSQKNNTLWHCGQNNLCRYFVSSDYTPSFFDWIGVFKSCEGPNVSGDKGYQLYAGWMSPVTPVGQKLCNQRHGPAESLLSGSKLTNRCVQQEKLQKLYKTKK